MLGVSQPDAEEVLERYWEAAKPKAIFRDRITQFWETKGDKKWIPGIDGKRIYTRSKHSVVNTAFQSCGAIAMEYSTIFMDKWLGGITLDKDGVPCYVYRDSEVYRVGYFHDEVIFEVPEHLAVEVGEMGVRSIESAGRMLKMRVPLTGEYKKGSSWAKTH